MRSTRDGRANLIMVIQSAMSDRDLLLLGWLYDHGLLTTKQIASALYPSLRWCQRRLRELTDYRLITRFRPFKLDGGSWPFHYVIDQLGAELIAAQRGENPPRADHSRTRRLRLTSRANLPHLLGVNQFFIDLATHSRLNPACQLRRWWPAARFHDGGGFPHISDDPLIITRMLPRPDGHGVWADGAKAVPFFLEYDTGTETLGVLIDKIRRYGNLGQRQWPVLFLLPTTARELNFHNAIAKHAHLRNTVIATAAKVYLDQSGLSPADPVWRIHGHAGSRLPLSDLPVQDPETFHSSLSLEEQL